MPPDSYIDVLQLEEFLPFRLSLLSNRVSQAISRLYAERFGLTILEWRVMALVGRHPGLTANDVAAQGAMDKVQVSRAVHRLLESNRLERRVDPEDRRRAALRLSAEGARVYREIVPAARDFEAHLLAPLSTGDRNLLDDLLTRLTAHTDDSEH